MIVITIQRLFQFLSFTMAKHVLNYAKHAVYHEIFMKKVYETYIKSMNIPKKQPYSVMDVGCGDGKIFFKVLHPLLPNNYKEIMASDIDDSMIEFCRSSNKNPKISFIKMDIETSEFSKTLEERFHVIFSSFCFMYVRNLRLGFTNCRRMLKPNGEILMVFISNKNPLYTTYAELSKIDMWKPYTKDYEGFIPHFSSEDPDSELNSLFKQVGLEVLSREFLHDRTYESEERNFLEVFKSMDKISRIIPDDKREKYEQDFQKVFSDVSGLDIFGKRNLDTISKMHIPTVVIHARKT